MTKRSVVAVLVLTLLTGGLYGFYWLVKTKDEMVARGADIPTAWLVIVPFAIIYWMWRWSVGVEYVTRGKASAVSTYALFVVLSLLGLGCVSVAIIQGMFNDAVDERVELPRARIA